MFATCFGRRRICVKQPRKQFNIWVGAEPLLAQHTICLPFRHRAQRETAKRQSTSSRMASLPLQKEMSPTQWLLFVKLQSAGLHRDL